MLGFLLIFISLLSNGQVGAIDGTVIYKPDSSKLTGTPVWILGTRIGTTTDINGYFKIDSLQIGTYELLIQYVGIGKDTIQNIVVNESSITTLNLGLPAGDCKGNQLKSCPIDGQKKEVIPIVYGLPGPKLSRKAENGKIRLGGCIVTGCDPKWYCQRHNHEY